LDEIMKMFSAAPEGNEAAELESML